METLDLKIKTPEEVWKDDKELLRRYNPQLPVNWTASLPNEREAFNLLVLKGQKWKIPSDPISLKQRIFEETLCKLVPELESIWETNLDVPEIEIIDTDLYMDRLNELARETNQMFGYGALFSSPPTMYLALTQKRLVIPRKFLMRVSKSHRASLSDKSDILEERWDRDFFEEVLSEELSHAIFRQIRNEWGKDYVRSMLELGSHKEERISRFNEVMAQYAKERLTQKNPGWGLYVVTEKISLIWGNRYAMRDYLGVDALSSVRSLNKIALIDDISADKSQGQVYIDFYPEHPSDLEKQKRFHMQD